MQQGIARYLVAAGLVRLADEGLRVLLLLLAIERLDSTAAGGLLVACFLIPHVIAAPTTGVLADRAINRSRFQAIALLGFGGSLAAVGALAGHVPLLVLVVIALAGGCLGPLVTGGMTSLLGLMTPPDDRERLYGLDVLTYNAAGIVGPAGSVFLAQILGPAPATIALGLSAAVGALLVQALPIPVGETEVRKPLTSRDVLSIDAIVLMMTNRRLRAATIGSSIGAAGFAAIPLATVLLAEEANRPVLTSLLIGATSVGGILGSMAYAWRPIGTGNPTRTVAIALAAIALPLGVALLGSENDLVLVGLFGLAGLPTGPLASSVFVVRDRESPDALQTQVFTFGAGLKMSCSALGALVAGVSTSAGVAGIIAGIVAVHLLAATVTIASMQRDRTSFRRPPQGG
jgi:MFS family permease